MERNCPEKNIADAMFELSSGERQQSVWPYPFEDADIFFVFTDRIDRWADKYE